jgi:hypothetical protein
VITCRQQTRRDLLLRFSLRDCAALSHALQRLCATLEEQSLAIDAQAPALNIRTPHVLALKLRMGSEDALHKAEDAVFWTFEPETVEELVVRTQRALEHHYFVPAELAIVKGPRDQWLRLYAEIDPAAT